MVCERIGTCPKDTSNGGRIRHWQQVSFVTLQHCPTKAKRTLDFRQKENNATPYWGLHGLERGKITWNRYSQSWSAWSQKEKYWSHTVARPSRKRTTNRRLVPERHGGRRRDKRRRPKMRRPTKGNAQAAINLREENQQIDYLARLDKRATKESSWQIRVVVEECSDTFDWASDGLEKEDEQPHWWA